MGTEHAIQELNLDEIGIPKVPSLLSWLEILSAWPQKWESEGLSEVLTTPTSTNESQLQETSTSSQSLFETCNLKVALKMMMMIFSKVAVMMTI